MGWLGSYTAKIVHVPRKSCFWVIYLVKAVLACPRGLRVLVMKNYFWFKL